jgi:murein DD-endopeptidase MepM/ murein hydrolase activator NlpD
LGRKKFTVLIFSQEASKVKKFILSPLSLKIAAALFSVFILVLAFFFHDYLKYKKRIKVVREVRTETQLQQDEILSFKEKINILETQLAKLREMEKQVEKELREVQELKKQKRVKKLSFPAASPKTPGVLQESAILPMFRKEEVCILEKERPRLVSRLNQDMLELHRESLEQTQEFHVLAEFLQAQKSFLQAIPSRWPVWGRITSRFGDTRISPESGGARPHLGIDIAVPKGTPILAPAAGVVTCAGREPQYGNMISIDHGYGYLTVYGHLQKILVKVGQKVEEGETIGLVGSTGSSTGPHLHYEVRLNGHYMNPAGYLNQRF